MNLQAGIKELVSTLLGHYCLNEKTLDFVSEHITDYIRDEGYRKLDEGITSKKYAELLMSVGNKYEGETRHQTALRYIREAEMSTDEAGAKCEVKGDKG